MPISGDWVTVGIDNGGTTNNGTVLDSSGTFLVTEMAELPSLVREGPDKAITALGRVMKAGSGGSSSNGRGKRKLSVAARKRIAAAQRARWAKVRAKKAA